MEKIKIDTFTQQYYVSNIPVDSKSFCVPNFPVNFNSISAPVGGRLRYFYDNWCLITQNPFVLNVIKHGYRIMFDSSPKLVVHPNPFELRLPPSQQEILDRELQAFLDNDVIEKADTSTPGYYSPVFLREKPRHNLEDPIKYRVIIDLSILNKSVSKVHFKMESTNSIRNTLQIGDHFYSLDLTMAYNTIPMAQSSRKYLRFWWNGVAYQFKALCFGLTTAPWIFSLVMAEMAKYFHRHSVYCIFYLDDVLFKDHNMAVLVSNQPEILSFIQALGWLINWDKSQLDITQRGVYVGTDYDLVHGLVFPPADRWIKLQNKIAAFLPLDCAPAQKWASLLGTITSCQDLVPLGRLMARPLQLFLNKHWRNRTDLRVLVPITSQVRLDLSWWTDHNNVMIGHHLRPPPPDLELWTDASLHGYGAHLLDHVLSGTWSPELARKHINFLELYTVKLALRHWEDIVTNQCLLVHVDNTTVIAYINKQGGARSPTLCHLTQEILTWCHQRNVILRAVHIKGSLNVKADYLSRKGSVIHTEWSLNPLIISKIHHQWIDPPQLDLFATKFNAKYPLYMSPVEDPQAMAKDALSQDWSSMIAYAYPPQAILPQVLNKILQHQCIVYLIAPNWPRMAWFPRILDLLIDYPRRIPLIPRLLTQPGTKICHLNPACLDLHVFKLSRDACKRRAFLLQLRNPSVKNTDSPLNNATNAIGSDTCLGVTAGMNIPSLLL